LDTSGLHADRTESIQSAVHGKVFQVPPAKAPRQNAQEDPHQGKEEKAKARQQEGTVEENYGEEVRAAAHTAEDSEVSNGRTVAS
jgi:hypothetical protein